MGGEVIEIDGSIMEGGGQIIRMAVAFSALLHKPIQLIKIRAGRSKPGLQSQHMTGINLLAELCAGRVTGSQLQSTSVKFEPGKFASRHERFTADTKTAGATTLLAQVALPCALLSKSSTTYFDFKGGTNADFSPQIEYYTQVFLPTLKQLGVSVQCKLIRKGYFPKGRGQIHLEVPPVKELKPIVLKDFGEVVSVAITASVAGTLPVRLAEEMARSAKTSFSNYLGPQSSVKISADAYKETERSAFGNGSSISIVAQTSSGCVLGSGRVGSRDKSGSDLGREAAEDLLASLERQDCVDEHLQDMLIIYMALAGGKSCIRTGPISLHTKTAIHIAERLTSAKFQIEESPTQNNAFFVTCEGISLKNDFL